MSTLIASAALAGSALLLMASTDAPALSQAQPGLWEISGVPSHSGPVRQCVADVVALTRFEHRANTCAIKSSKQTGSSAAIDYSCGGAGFGHSEIDVITPRSLRISTQGISGGLPFNYVLQARRVSDCAKDAVVTRH